MNRTALERPFPPEVVKTRTTVSNKELAFVGGVHYVRRLNDAFDSKWTWRIASHEVHGAHVVVHGVLAAEGYEKHAFGGWSISVNKETGEVGPTADDLKAAATDALKKAASLFGVGLDLYDSGDSTKGSDSRGPTPKGGHEAPAERTRITAKQLKAIFAIARIKNMSDAQLRQTCIKRYGSPPDFMSKTNASTFIDELKAS